MKCHGVDRAAAKIQPSHLKEKNQKKKKQAGGQEKQYTAKKLQTRESKLKEKSDSKKRRKKKKPKSQNKTSLSDKLKKSCKGCVSLCKKTHLARKREMCCFLI